MSEQELDLVRRAKNGDPDAFEQLLHTYEKRVYNLAFRMCRNGEDALDLSQDIFIRVYKSLAFFEEKSQFSTWLYSIASNACIDFKRKQNKRKTVSLYMSNEEDHLSALDIPDMRFHPEQEFEKKELRAEIEAALSSLSDDHREILILREINGLSYHEISETLDLECGTVKSRICRAREQLCRLLAKSGNNSKRLTSKAMKER